MPSQTPDTVIGDGLPATAVLSHSADPALGWTGEVALQIQYRPLAELKPSENNPRTHSKKQIAKIAAAIREFGFTNPIITDEAGKVIAGHGRLASAKSLGMKEVPTICLSHLSEAQKRAYIIADNRLAELAGWDREILAIEFKALSEIDVGFEVEITGFEMPQIDLILGSDAAQEDPADEVEEPKGPAVSRLGDLWLLGPHRLLCSDARERDGYDQLLGRDTAQMVFIDAPYNRDIRDISGLGRTRHANFAMGSGELSGAEFTGFLESVFRNLAAASSDGSIHYVCMGWRGMYETQTAGRAVYGPPKQLVVWNKTNAGMSSFYRSKHELIFVFKNGSAPHINNFLLGETGRYRTNVWDYPGANTFRPGRMEELEAHPTPKPVALVVDAIRDCSKRRGIVLDVFGGGGTTLIAAHRTGRRGYLMEIDPGYVDVSVRRWERFTGETARHALTGRSFADMAAERLATSDREVCHGR